jgi:hypothetical protein
MFPNFESFRLAWLTYDLDSSQYGLVGVDSILHQIQSNPNPGGLDPQSPSKEAAKLASTGETTPLRLSSSAICHDVNLDQHSGHEERFLKPEWSIHGFSSEKREQLGSVEYKAIKLLAWLVPIYFIFVSNLCSGCA